MRFSICPEMLYPKVKLEKRIALVAKHGFTLVDLWDMRPKDMDALRVALRENGVRIAAFSGNRDASASIAQDRKDFLDELRTNIRIAEQLECERLIITSDGLRPPHPGDPAVVPAKPNQISDGEKMRNMSETFADAAELAEKSEVTLLLELLNPIDHPDYFLTRSRWAFELVRKVRSKRFKVLYDIYHMQRGEGDVTHVMTENLDRIGHIHFADSPGRNEPGTGELYLPNILKALDASGYDRIFAFEYRPLAEDGKTLDHIAQLIRPYAG